ncbi:MAG: hypothetical protein J5811_06465 [Lachnospiraceae bacterium]|nr:hypothetical protein [Lachnospiraceae bacterium]
MKQLLIKSGVFLITFIVAIIVLSKIMNRGNTDLTQDMQQATFPLLYMVCDGERYNCVHGYADTMNPAYERNTMTVLNADRMGSVEIDDFGSDIRGITYEVRDVSGQRLIESTEVTDFNTTDTGVMFDYVVKDLIMEDTEYSLIFLVDIGNTVVRYYTRIVWTDDYHLKECIDYVKDFSIKTFNKDEAQSIRRYLESNSSGDNTSFAKVNIHSSFSQVTWGDMAPVRITEPIPSVRQIAPTTASISLSYYVTTGEGEEAILYHVDEYYRVRYSETRMYLLDFERDMEQILKADEIVIDNNRLDLGIINPDFSITESEAGNIIVFKNFGRLFSYSMSDNKLSVLYSFYDGSETDDRTTYNCHDMKVINVDEAGNVRFMVYGYMNRGRHEGEVGINIVSYDGATNTLEEEAFIPYDKSADILMNEMEKLHYVNKEDTLFVILERATYAVDIGNKNYDIMMEQTGDDALYVSDSGKMIVWETSENAYNCEELLLMDLETHSTAAIDANEGDYIFPLGFIGEDLVYGTAHSEDLVKDASGNMIFPMYAVYIRNTAGAILKTYNPGDIYVVSGDIEGNQITLHRVKKKGDNDYESVTDDQIVNSSETGGGINSVTSYNDETRKKCFGIVFKNTASKKSIQVRNPKEIIFEGNRNINVKMVTREETLYYAYSMRGLSGIFASASHAVNEAYKKSGVVTNDLGDYVFIKGNRSTRNQIMTITATSIEGNGNSVSVCLDTILAREGIVRNTATELTIGKTPYSIIKDSLVDTDVLDLTGCPLDAVLYYVNKDIPVMAVLDSGEAVLVTGFNEVAVVIMDPVSGTLSKKGMQEASEWFASNGNTFLTYNKPTLN